jgi:hypothetical protein
MPTAFAISSVQPVRPSRSLQWPTRRPSGQRGANGASVWHAEQYHVRRSAAQIFPRGVPERGQGVCPPAPDPELVPHAAANDATGKAMSQVLT